MTTPTDRYIDMMNGYVDQNPEIANDSVTSPHIGEAPKSWD